MSLAGRINRLYIRYIRRHTIKILSWIISFFLGLILYILLFYPEPGRWQNVITLLAVLTSLFIGGLPEFRKWKDRPQIEFDYDRALDNTGDGKSLHLKITNVGKTTARNVNVRVVDHLNALRKQRYPHYLLQDVDLQNKYSRTIQLFSIFSDEDKIYGLHRTADNWYDSYFSLEEDEKIFDVLVTGDNFSARTFHIFLNRKEDWKETDFNIAWSF